MSPSGGGYVLSSRDVSVEVGTRRVQIVKTKLERIEETRKDNQSVVILERRNTYLEFSDYCNM